MAKTKISIEPLFVAMFDDASRVTKIRPRGQPVGKETASVIILIPEIHLCGTPRKENSSKNNNGLTWLSLYCMSVVVVGKTGTSICAVAFITIGSICVLQ